MQPLSTREKQILQLVADGNSPDSVAAKLEPATTEGYIKNNLLQIRRKLDAVTTCEAVAKGIRQGLLR